MPSKRIPLVGSLMNRANGTTISNAIDQKFINCYPEIARNRITGGGTVQLIKRNGTELEATVASSGYIGQTGGCNWTGTGGDSPVFSVANSSTNVIKVYDYSGAQIGGDISSAGYLSCLFIEETTVSNAAYLVAIIPDGSVKHAWYYTSGGAWTRITDADYPPNQGTPLVTVGAPAFMDGYMFIQDNNGKIWNSDINSLSSWTSTSFIDAQQYPDLGSGLMRYKSYIMAAGRTSIEFFHNTGNATGSPLTRVSGATIDIGVLPMTSNRTMLAVGESIYFIGSPRGSGTLGVYRLAGMAAQKISTAAVDEYIASLKGAFAIEFVGVWSMSGMTHVVMNLGNTSSTSITTALWCYCVETSVWWMAYFGSSTLPRFITNGPFQKSYMMNYDRTIYKWSTAYRDNASDYSMVVQTMPLDMGTPKNKEFTRFDIIGDDQSVSASVTVAWSSDDYATTSSGRSMSILSAEKSISAGLGWGRRRSWKITDSANRPFRAEAFEVEWQVSEE